MISNGSSGFNMVLPVRKGYIRFRNFILNQNPFSKFIGERNIVNFKGTSGLWGYFWFRNLVLNLNLSSKKCSKAQKREFKRYFRFDFRCAFSFNSQAPARKSNPQAPVAPCAAISVKTCFESSEIKTNVFTGAENH